MPEVTACGTCGGTDLVPVLDMGDQPLAEHNNGLRYPLKLLQCEDCGLVQLSRIVDREEVFPENHPYTTGNTKERIRHFELLAREVTWMTEPGDLVIDIGANDGTFLQAVRDADYRSTLPLRLTGVEPTGQAAKCSAKGIPVNKEFFTADLAFRMAGLGCAKVITACNVLAHVPDPHDFLKGVRTLLRTDGTLVIENHDWNSVNQGLQIDTVYHEHARYYTVESLARLLAMHKFTITSAERIPAHGGSHRVMATGAYPILVKPGEVRYSLLEQRAQGVRKRLQGLLKGLTGPLYGIGATTRATPLIHYMGLGQWVHCVCEVPFSDKIGSLIPGTLIPVVDEKKLIEDQPPYALIFAWHIADDIAPKLRQMGYKGKFIIPLPEPMVTDPDQEIRKAADG